MKQVIFTLSSARSGTVYLRHLFQNNIPACVCRHEPFFDWGNPTLFGPAIYDAFAGRIDRIRARLARKRRYIDRLRGGAYLESSHAFLKSSYVAALEFFPDMRLVHLVRNPLKVAKSEAYREQWRRRVHAPFHFYRGDDGCRHFCWALTGNEEIFRCYDRERLTLFEWYLIQWIEIENRAMRFLDEHKLHERCFSLHSTEDLNDPARIRSMFDFLGLQLRLPDVVFGGRKNKSFGVKTVITGQDETECETVLKRMPSRFLEIFHRPPYVNYPWSERLRRNRVVTSSSPPGPDRSVPTRGPCRGWPADDKD